MTRKLSIIGSGHVGAAVAHQLVVTGLVDELVLLDQNEAHVQADALDLRDAMANLPSRTNILVNDWEAIGDSDIIVSAYGDISLCVGDNHDRFAELKRNRADLPEIAKKIKANGFDGVLINITNPCDAIAQLYQEETGLAKDQVIGTGTLLDSARMKRVVGETFGIDPRSVQGYALGEHGDSQFVAWSKVSVLGQPIEKLARERGIDLAELEEATRQGGVEVMIGKQYTNYGIAAACVRLVTAVFNDAHIELPVSNYREEYDSYLSYPAIVGRKGVLYQEAIDLTPAEAEKLQKSANFIKDKVKQNS